MRRIAALTLGTVAFLAFFAAPASADGGLPFPGAQGSSVASVSGSSNQAPSEWNWTWSSNTQSQNGLANLANNGNLCTGVAGLLAPAASCTNS